MNATDVLRQEHRVIEQVLHALEAIVAEAMETGILDRTAAKNAVAFLRNFADRCHHGKEENCLFPAVEAKGFSCDGGPTGVMLHEHQLGRIRIDGMDENIAAAAGRDQEALRRFVEHSEGYVSLLRRHIFNEDHILFRLADQSLSDDEQQALLAAFQQIEIDEMGVGTHERFMQIAGELSHRYGLPVSASSKPAMHLHCCCVGS